MSQNYNSGIIRSELLIALYVPWLLFCDFWSISVAKLMQINHIYVLHAIKCHTDYKMEWKLQFYSICNLFCVGKKTDIGMVIF